MGNSIVSSEIKKSRHNILAPYWAIALALLWGVGISTIWIDLGAFWKGYILAVGPAWNYILFRGLFTAKADNAWTRFFTPKKTFFIFLIVCFSIEGAQYFNLYESTYDPWNLIAYISILTPLYLLDSIQIKHN